MITIDKETFNRQVLEYLEKNQKLPKKEQTLPYKELEQVLNEKGILMADFIKEWKEANEL